jgi:hypothetical protein
MSSEITITILEENASPDPQDAASLASTPGVKAIRPIVRYETQVKFSIHLLDLSHLMYLNPIRPVTAKVVSGLNDPAVPADISIDTRNDSEFEWFPFEKSLLGTISSFIGRRQAARRGDHWI